MKNIRIWKYTAVAALVFGLGACTNSASPDDDEDDVVYSSAKEKSEKSSSSSAKTTSTCKNVTESLAAPTNLEVVKNGDNKWVLIWSYSANDDRPEKGFVIEYLNMADSLPNWKTEGYTNEAVVMYNLSGESKAGKYYRVSAKDDCGVSKATSMVEVTKTGANTTTSAELAAPTNLKLESLGDNMWQLSWSYTNNENRPEQGFNLQSLNLDDASPKWTDAGTTNKGVHVVKIDGNKKGGLLYHVAAKDNNGVSEYSEEITIPSATDNTSSSADKSMDLAVPTDLAFEAVGASTYKLAWNYTDNTNRPENGFKLQILDLNEKTPKWAVLDSTNKSVNMILIDVSKNGGKYIRVAAKDSKGLSAFSEVVQVPKIGGDVENNEAPTNLALVRVAPSVWELSWNYSETNDDPNRKFIIQSSKLKDFKWTALKTPIEGNVRHYYIEGRDQIESYYRMAVVNGSDTSAFTEAIQLTPNIAYRSFMSLTVPEFSFTATTFKTKFVDSENTSYEAITGAVGTYTISNNMISKYIVESEYTDTVYYEARWFTSLEHYNYFKENCEGKKTSDKCDSCYWTETFPYQEPSISKRFDAMTDFADADKATTKYEDCYYGTSDSDGLTQCLLHYVKGICGYFVQFRIVWKDNVNGKGKGATDWSEWTTPYHLNDHEVCSAQ